MKRQLRNCATQKVPKTSEGMTPTDSRSGRAASKSVPGQSLLHVEAPLPSVRKLGRYWGKRSSVRVASRRR